MTEKIEFKNTDIYPNVDWDSEIANEGSMSEEQHARRSSDALFAMLQIRESIDKKIKEVGPGNIEPHKKANMMRMIEYLYCKFSYHHAMFYRKKEFLDLLKSQKSYHGLDHPVLSLKKKLGETIKSTIPLKTLQQLEKAMAKDIRKKMDESKPKDGGFNEAKKMFEKEGFKIYRPKGLRKESDRDTVCVKHDGIRYHLYLMKGDRKQVDAHREANDHKSMISKYHPIIKTIHDKMKSGLPGMENLWVMEGGGTQHQAFFGNEDGYIGILYMGMKNSKATKDLTLVFECYEDGPKWKTYKDFKVEGVECQAFGETDSFKDDKF